MKLLFIAYKIEKDKGSEDGTGYNVAKLLAQENMHLTIITRQNNIDKLQSESEFSNVRFIPVEVPKKIAFFKKKSRGITLYYYLWQVYVGYKIYQLQKTEQFDVIHQFNFHATWAPHFIFSKSKIIWGPLTHHASVPFSFWKGSRHNYPLEVMRRLIKRFFFYIDPFLKWALHRSNTVLLGYRDYIGSYRVHKNKTFLMPQARSVFPVLTSKTQTNEFNILFVGRFVSLKGCVTALLAVEQMLSHLPKERQELVTLTMIGEGGLLNAMRVVAKRIVKQTKANIKIMPWVNQPELIDYYSKSSLFLFPSFEGQGLVVAEAMAHGCPVLCLEDTGPAAIAANAAVTVSKKNLNKTVSILALELEHLANEYWYKNELYQKRVDSALQRANDLTWEKKVESLMEYYHA